MYSHCENRTSSSDSSEDNDDIANLQEAVAPELKLYMNSCLTDETKNNSQQSLTSNSRTTIKGRFLLGCQY